MKNQKFILKILKNLTGTVMGVCHYSPAGEDCTQIVQISEKEYQMSLKNFPLRDDNFALLFNEELQRFYDNYDVSYETSLWIGANGHGINGAPYDIGDIYKDKKHTENSIKASAEGMKALYDHHMKNCLKPISAKAVGKEFLHAYELCSAQNNLTPLDVAKKAMEQTLSFEKGDCEKRKNY